LGAIAGFSGMESVYRFWLVIVMALLFVIVIGAVIYLTVKYPTHLYNQVSAEIEKAELFREFINSEGFKDAIRESVRESVSSLVKAECLIIEKDDGDES
jgi:hypothetical protein